MGHKPGCPLTETNGCLHCDLYDLRMEAERRIEAQRIAQEERESPKPADKPECRTCPLWLDQRAGGAGSCHLAAVPGAECTTREDWYCEHHPDYPAWAIKELARRKAAKEEDNEGTD